MSYNKNNKFAAQLINSTYINAYTTHKHTHLKITSVKNVSNKNVQQLTSNKNYQRKLILKIFPVVRSRCTLYINNPKM